jgi:hypothetical protein
VDKGHGRIETRLLEASETLNDYLDWPDQGQVLRRTCRRVSTTTGAICEKVRYGITSLPLAAADAMTLEGLWRGHWTIENRVYYPRGVALGEDAGQARVRPRIVKRACRYRGTEC